MPPLDITHFWAKNDNYKYILDFEYKIINYFWIIIIIRYLFLDAVDCMENYV